MKTTITTVEQAAKAGRAAGRTEAADIFNEKGLDALKEAIDGVGLSEGAAGARAHAIDGVPDEDELRAAYYRGYDEGAQAWYRAAAAEAR